MHFNTLFALAAVAIGVNAGAAEDCGSLGVFAPASLPEGVDPAAVRKCLEHPLGGTTRCRQMDLSGVIARIKRWTKKFDEWLDVPIWKLADGSVVLHVSDFVGLKKGKTIADLRAAEESRKKQKGKEEPESDSDGDDDAEWGAPGSKKRRPQGKYVDVTDDETPAAEVKSGSSSSSRVPAKRKKTAADTQTGDKKRSKVSAQHNPVGGGKGRSKNTSLGKPNASAPIENAVAPVAPVPTPVPTPVAPVAAAVQHGAATVENAVAPVAPVPTPVPTPVAPVAAAVQHGAATVQNNAALVQNGAPPLNLLDEALGLGQRGMPYDPRWAHAPAYQGGPRFNGSLQPFVNGGTGGYADMSLLGLGQQHPMQQFGNMLPPLPPMPEISVFGQQQQQQGSVSAQVPGAASGTASSGSESVFDGHSYNGWL